MKEHHTDKELLVKGLQNMGICLVLMFLGPTLLYIAISNQDKPTYLLVLIISIMVCFLAIFFLFRGINIIMKSMFRK
ncbi:MAG: DUF6095 family protein [Aquaticitalea sp.]